MWRTDFPLLLSVTGHRKNSIVCSGTSIVPERHVESFQSAPTLTCSVGPDVCSSEKRRNLWTEVQSPHGKYRATKGCRLPRYSSPMRMSRGRTRANDGFARWMLL